MKTQQQTYQFCCSGADTLQAEDYPNGWTLPVKEAGRYRTLSVMILVSLSTPATPCMSQTLALHSVHPFAQRIFLDWPRHHGCFTRPATQSAYSQSNTLLTVAASFSFLEVLEVNIAYTRLPNSVFWADNMRL